MDERILLPVGDPDFARAGFLDGLAKAVPISMVEMTSGNSTPRCRARARTRIQPLAATVSGSAKRRDQISERLEGGQMRISPARLPRGRPAARASGPSAMPASS